MVTYSNDFFIYIIITLKSHSGRLHQICNLDWKHHRGFESHLQLHFYNCP